MCKGPESRVNLCFIPSIGLSSFSLTAFPQSGPSYLWLALSGNLYSHSAEIYPPQCSTHRFTFCPVGLQETTKQFPPRLLCILEISSLQKCWRTVQSIHIYFSSIHQWLIFSHICCFIFRYLLLLLLLINHLRVCCKHKTTSYIKLILRIRTFSHITSFLLYI